MALVSVVHISHEKCRYIRISNSINLSDFKHYFVIFRYPPFIAQSNRQKQQIILAVSCFHSKF